MLFCFGLFALLLYYTVVANAECSYTYRNSSQHIEAESQDYERQGFRRCEFLIQLVKGRQQLQLNFTRLSGFVLHAPLSHHGQPLGPGQAGAQEEEGGGRGVVPDHDGADQEEGELEEEKEEKEEGGESREREGTGDSGGEGSHRPVTTTPSHQPGGAGRKGSPKGARLSPILSLSSPRPRHTAPTPVTTQTPRYANSNGSKTVADPSLSAVRTTVVTPGGTAVTPPGTDSPQPTDGRGAPCLPKVEILEVVEGGREERRQLICEQHHNTQTPIVFHYASSVRIVYEWEHEHNSGFTLYFDYNDAQKKEKCVHTCDSSRCLTDSRQLCDGHADCHDQSDERTAGCVATVQTDGDNLVTVIVLPACVAVLLVLCVLCLFLRRHWAPLHRTMHRANGHAAHLALPQSHSSEGLTPSSQDCNEQAVALLSSAHRSHKSWHHPPHTPSPAPPPPPDPPQVGLPPNIPVSPDGEEGYNTSQLRLLHPRYHHTAHSQLFKAPPNKTVYDRESPPPYSLTPSPGTYTYSSAPAASSSPPVMGRGQFVPVLERLVRDSEGQPVVSRCYTMCQPTARRPHRHHHQHNNHQLQGHSASALTHSQQQRHHPSPHAGGGSDSSGSSGSGGYSADHPYSSDNNSNNTNSNSFAGRYHQRPPHVHGAFTVKDVLHPPAPPPLLLDSSPSVGVRRAASHGQPSPSSPSPCPSPALSVMPGGWDSDSCSLDSGGVAPLPQDCEAPPSYESTLSQVRAGDMDNNNCQGNPSPLTNTCPSSPPLITTPTTTTTTTNNNTGASGV